MSEWRGGDWTKALRDEELKVKDDEDGVRRIIVEVAYDRADDARRPVCAAKGGGDAKRSREYMYKASLSQTTSDEAKRQERPHARSRSRSRASIY